jgi:hypothetical protein
MKLVVQDGAGLSRRTLEKVLPLFPAGWRSQVQTIVVYATHQESLTFSYGRQAQVLGVHWPSFEASAPSREHAVRELGIMLAVIAKLGELPRKLSKSARAAALNDIEQELPAWLAAAEE